MQAANRNHMKRLLDGSNPVNAEDRKRKKVSKTVMSEKQKELFKSIVDELPGMDERGKGYFLGYAEAMAAQKENKEKKEKLDKEEE